jgi:hypothetical protein
MTLALGVCLSIAAYAYWGAGGTGAGTSITSTTTSISISAGTPASALYPGGLADVVATISNPNESPIHVTSLGLDTTQGTAGYSVDTMHPGCSVTALTYSTQLNGGNGWTVPARTGAVNGTMPVTLPGALAMSTSAASACQGATFTIYLKAS